MCGDEMNRKGASSIEEIVVVIILVIFAIVFFIIIHSGFLSSLLPSNFLLFSSPNSGPAMCFLNASRIQNSACGYMQKKGQMPVTEVIAIVIAIIVLALGVVLAIYFRGYIFSFIKGIQSVLSFSWLFGHGF